MKSDTKSKLNKIFNYYGFKKQYHKLIEEMAELIQAIEKEESKDSIIEELADVQIVLMQLRLNLNSSESKEFVKLFNEKIERQLNRIESEKNRI